jgi:hypothetical protein
MNDDFAEQLKVLLYPALTSNLFHDNFETMQLLLKAAYIFALKAGCRDIAHFTEIAMISGTEVNIYLATAVENNTAAEEIAQLNRMMES